MAEARRRTVRRRRVTNRYADAPYGYYDGDCPVGGVFRAAAYAAADALMGMSRVASILVIDASDSLVGRRTVVLDYEYEVEPEDLDVETTRAEEFAEIEFEGDDVFVAYEEEDLPFVRGTFCDSFNRAFIDGSRVVSRSARRFADELDDERAYRARRRVRIVRRGGKRARAAREETISTTETKTEVKTEERPTSPPPGGSPLV